VIQVRRHQVTVTDRPLAAFRTPEASENLPRRAIDIAHKVQGYPA